MHLASIVVPNYLMENKIFSEELNREKHYVNSKYILIKKLLKESNIELNTHDLNSGKKTCFSIYLDNVNEPNDRLNYLIVREPSIIHYKNHSKKHFNKYKKIFTYNDDLVDGIKIIKYNTQSFDFEKINIKSKENQSGYTLICSNKKSNKVGENYSTRYNLIDYLKNSDLKFSLYGRGWTKVAYPNRYLEAIFNRIPIFRPNLSINNYKGEVNDKRENASSYLFQFAIENSKVINGYITEKIFDAFFSNCIPIYSGTKSISNYIPNETFINIDDFESFDQLFEFTENLNKKNIMNYRLARDNFFKSKNIKLFDIKYNSKILVDGILKDL
jgi:alpha(1,3/1,4) fucosyltransferase